MKIKTTERYYFTYTRTDVINGVDNSMCGKGCEVCTFLPHSKDAKFAHSSHTPRMQNGSAAWKKSPAVLHNVDRVTIKSSNPTYPFVTIYLPQYIPKRTKKHVHTKTCRHMFMAALFKIARKWKQPKFPSSVEWENKIWYIPTTSFWASLVAQWKKKKKKSAYQCWRLEFNPWVRKITWKGKCQPTLVFLPGKSHGQRSLAGYSPWGHRVRHD